MSTDLSFCSVPGWQSDSLPITIKNKTFTPTQRASLLKQKELRRLRSAGLELVFSVFSDFEQTQTFQEKNGYMTTPRTLPTVCNLKISSIANISFKFVNS